MISVITLSLFMRATWIMSAARSPICRCGVSQLDVEPEVHHIVLAHDVFFSLEAQLFNGVGHLLRYLRRAVIEVIVKLRTAAAKLR
jgi:hypothetical protein